MNRIGIYYAYWERDWAADLVAYPPRAARLGFDVLEVKLSQAVAMPARRRQDLRRSAQDHGIEITFCDGLRQENDISSSDPAVRARGIEHLKRGLDVIHEMGGSVLGGIIYGAWNPPPTKEPAKREHVERSVDSMREIMATAEGLGITCCVEVVNRFEQFMLNTCAEAVEYVGSVQSPHLKIMLDTFHMNIEEDSIRGAVLLAGQKLGISTSGRPIAGRPVKVGSRGPSLRGPYGRLPTRAVSSWSRSSGRGERWVGTSACGGTWAWTEIPTKRRARRFCSSAASSPPRQPRSSAARWFHYDLHVPVKRGIVAQERGKLRQPDSHGDDRFQIKSRGAN